MHAVRSCVSAGHLVVADDLGSRAVVSCAVQCRPGIYYIVAVVVTVQFVSAIA